MRILSYHQSWLTDLKQIHLLGMIGAPAYKENSCEFFKSGKYKIFSFFFFRFVFFKDVHAFFLVTIGVPCYCSSLFLPTEKKRTLPKSQYFGGISQDSHWNGEVSPWQLLRADQHRSSIYTSKYHTANYYTCTKLSLVPYFQGKWIFAIRHSEIQHASQLF